MAALRQNSSPDGTVLEQWDDAVRVYTDFRADPDTSRPYTDEENAAADARAADAQAATNAATLRDRARTAVQGNRDFLALASPTNAQTLAQVKALTRQNNAIIPLVLGVTATTDVS